MKVSSSWERHDGEKGKQLRQSGTAFQLREAISHLSLPTLLHTAYWRAAWKHRAGMREGAVSHTQVCTLSTPKSPYSTYPPFLQQQYGLSSLLCRSVYFWHENYRALKLVLHATSKVLKLRVTDQSLCLLTATSSNKEYELTTWWGEWAHVIQNLGTEHKGKHHEES